MTIFQSFWCIIKKNNDKHKTYSNCKCMIVTTISYMVSIKSSGLSEPYILYMIYIKSSQLSEPYVPIKWLQLVLWNYTLTDIFYHFNCSTVGTPYNTNVGVQKIHVRAIWKPMVAKRNNTNPWSWLRPQILVTQDFGQPHMSKQPASRDWPEQIPPLVHSSQTAWQLFNLGQSIEIRIPHLLGHVGQLHTKCISHIWLRFSVL